MKHPGISKEPAAEALCRRAQTVCNEKLDLLSQGETGDVWAVCISVCHSNEIQSCSQQKRWNWLNSARTSERIFSCWS